MAQQDVDEDILRVLDELYVDNIIENSSGSGVTIEGVKIEDQVVRSLMNVIDDKFRMLSNIDETISVLFSVGGTTGTNTQFVINQTVNRILTFPDEDGTLLTREGSSVLLNKDITDPSNNVIASGLFADNGNVVVDVRTAIGGPSTGDILVATSGTSASWQSLGDAGLVSDGDNLGSGIEVFAGKNGTVLEFKSIISENNAISIIDANGSTEVEFEFIPGNVDINDFGGVPLRVSSGGTGTNSLTIGNMLTVGVGGTVETVKTTPIGDVVGTSDTQTLTGKTIAAVSNNVGANSLRTLAGSFVDVDGNNPTVGDVLVITGATSAEWQSLSTAGIVTDGDSLGSGFDIYIGKTAAGVLEFNSLISSDNSIGFGAGGVGEIDIVVDPSNININNLGGSPLGISGGGTGVTSFGANAVLTTNGSGTLVTTKAVPSGDFVGTTDTQILTNKSITDPSNNIIASGLFADNGNVVVDVRTAIGGPSTGDILVATSGTSASWQSLGDAGLVSDGDNLGSGIEVFAGKNGTILEFKSIVSENNAISVIDASGSTEVEFEFIPGNVDINDLGGVPLTSSGGGTGLVSLTADRFLTVNNAGTAYELVKSVPSGVVVGTSDTQVLINKTITDVSNDVRANSLAVNGGSGVSVNGDVPAGANEVLVTSSTSAAIWRTLADIASDIDINDLGGVPLEVSNGGTGLVSLGSGKVLVGDGTNPINIVKDAPSGDFVGTTDTQVLTNKSIIDPNNTVVASGLFADNGNVVIDVRTAVGGPSTGDILVATSSTAASWQSPSTSGVVVNATNIGSGIGLFNNKTVAGVLEFNSLVSADSSIDIGAGGAGEVNLVVDPSVININNLGGSPLGISGGGTGVTSFGSNAVLTTDGSGFLVTTKAVPTGDFVGTTDTQILSNKTITDSGSTIYAKALFHSAGIVDTSLSPAPVLGSILVAQSGSSAIWQTVSFGESNTASNIGVGGVGLFNSKVGIDLQFKNINTTNAAITIVDDVANKEVDIGFDPTAVDINDLGGVPLTSSSGGTGLSSLIGDKFLTVNAAGTAYELVKDVPVGDVVGTSDTQVLTNKTITSSSNDIIARSLFVNSGAGNVSTFASGAPSIGDLLVATSPSTAEWQTLSLGQDNTASNIGIGGVGLFDTKVGVDLQFKNINTTSAVITIVDDVVNKEVDIGFDSSSVNINTLGGGPLDISGGGTGVTSFGTNAVLTTDGSGSLVTTKAVPTGDFVGTTDTQVLTGKTIIDSSNLVVASGLFSDNGANIINITASSNPSSGDILVAIGPNNAEWQTVNFGESNTASNVGGGIGVFKQKNGIDLEFKTLISGDNSITIDGSATNTIDLSVDESQLNINNIGGTPLSVPNGGTGRTELDSGNVLVGTGTSAVLTTKAAPNGNFVGTSDTQTLTNKDITSVTNNVTANSLRSPAGAVAVDSTGPSGANEVLVSTGTNAATWQTLSVTNSLKLVKLINVFMNNCNNSTAGNSAQFNTTASVNTDAILYTPNANGVEVTEAGIYKVNASLYMIMSNSFRTNVAIEITVNGTQNGIRGAGGYIRNASGHNESSTEICDVVQVNANDIIGFDMIRLANAGNVSAPTGKSTIIVQRIS